MLVDESHRQGDRVVKPPRHAEAVWIVGAASQERGESLGEAECLTDPAFGRRPVVWNRQHLAGLEFEGHRRAFEYRRRASRSRIGARSKLGSHLRNGPGVLRGAGQKCGSPQRRRIDQEDLLRLRCAIDGGETELDGGLAGAVGCPLGTTGSSDGGVEQAFVHTVALVGEDGAAPGSGFVPVDQAVFGGDACRGRIAEGHSGPQRQRRTDGTHRHRRHQALDTGSRRPLDARPGRQHARKANCGNLRGNPREGGEATQHDAQDSRIANESLRSKQPRERALGAAGGVAHQPRRQRV